MDKMIAADCGAIAIPSYYHYLELRIRQLYARSKSNCATVRCMKRIEIEIANRAA